jgi:hypothetical protein
MHFCDKDFRQFTGRVKGGEREFFGIWECRAVDRGGGYVNMSLPSRTELRSSEGSRAEKPIESSLRKEKKKLRRAVDSEEMND